MRVFYLCRLVSGLVSTLREERWVPNGAPAIYKLVEALDRGEHETRFVMTVKGNRPEHTNGWEKESDCTVFVKGLKAPIRVLSGRRAAFFASWRFGKYFNELRQLWNVLLEIRLFRPDVIYADRSNVILAGILARVLRVPVVLRVLGVTPSMRGLKKSIRPYDMIQRWCYRAKFSLVICTMDGSGGDRWMKEMLREGVTRVLLLNGVDIAKEFSDPDPRISALPKEPKIVLFLGRLETLKGVEVFIEAMLRLHKSHKGLFHALVVGSGSKKSSLLRQISESNANEMFTFIDELPHEQVSGAFFRSDYYVSLNKQGNLSNSNLEAISFGCCMIIPRSQPDVGVDLETDKLLPGESVVRIPIDNSIDALADSLVWLAENPEAAEAKKKNLKKNGRSILKSWQERITAEIEMLTCVVEGKNPMPVIEDYDRSERVFNEK